jgi:hypothetical protein
MRGIRLLAADPVQGLREFERVWREVVAAFARSGAEAEPAAERAARELALIPRRKSIDEVKKVLVVGEIYVRRDTFSVQEITKRPSPRASSPATGLTGGCTTPITAALACSTRSGDAKFVYRDPHCWIAPSASSSAWSGCAGRGWQARPATTGFAVGPIDTAPALEAGGRTRLAPTGSEAPLAGGGGGAMQDGYAGIAIIAPLRPPARPVDRGRFAPGLGARLSGAGLENDGQLFAERAGAYRRCSRTMRSVTKGP